MYGLPDHVLQIIHDFVPRPSYDYMDGLTELLVIAAETGVTPLGRLQQERAMRVSLRVYAQVNERFHMALEDLTNDEEEMVGAAMHGAYVDVTSLYPAVYDAFVDED